MSDSNKDAILQGDADNRNGQSAPNTSSWGFSERNAYQAQSDYLKKLQEDAKKTT